MTFIVIEEGEDMDRIRQSSHNQNQLTIQKEVCWKVKQRQSREKRPGGAASGGRLWNPGVIIKNTSIKVQYAYLVTSFSKLKKASGQNKPYLNKDF